MLEAAGARIVRRPGLVTVEPGGPLRLGEGAPFPVHLRAAPFLVAAALLPGSTLTVHDVGLTLAAQPGILDVLERMGGADIQPHSLHRRRADRRHRDRLAAARRTPDRVAEVPSTVHQLPLAALRRPRRRATTPRKRRPAESRGEGVWTGSTRSRPGCAESAPTSRRKPMASPSAVFPRVPVAGASTPPATTGSRCSAQLPARSHAKESSRRVSLGRFRLRLLGTFPARATSAKGSSHETPRAVVPLAFPR